MTRAILLATTALLTAAPAAWAANGSADGGADGGGGGRLALTRVLLSTGGVGYFEYEATVSGDADLSLEVRRDQVDDVLKSIVVYDDKGGVGTIGLPGAEPLDTAFRELPFSAGDLHSPAALLSAMRGAEVTAGGSSQLTGRLMSVTEETARLPGGDNATVTRHRVTLMTADGMRQLVLEEADTLRFTNPAVQAQIDKALAAVADNARRERRRLTVQSHAPKDGQAGGERRVRVGYVAEMPLWKATYRLSLGADGAPAGTGRPPDGRGALQGWAVLENLSGEDWRGVDLTVVSGNPVTLRQALYTPYFVERPEVPVEVLGRVLPSADEGTVTLDAARPAMRAESSRPAPAPAMAAPAPMAERMAEPMAKTATAPYGSALGTPAVAAVDSAEAGTAEGAQVLFHYPQPVTVPNGGTLMMPIAARAMPVERVALYQPATAARHPLAALRLRNDGDTALPPGLLTFYDRASGTAATAAAGNTAAGNTAAGNTAYVGDARMATLPAGDSRLLSFAVDQSVTVDREEKPDRRLSRATIADGVLTLSVIDRQTTIYTVAGAPDGDRNLVIEHPRRAGWTLAEAAGGGTDGKPDATAIAYRLPLAVPAGKTVTLTATLERPRQERIVLTDLSADQIAARAAATELPAEVRQALTAMAGLRAAVAEKERRIAELERDRTDRIADQDRLRENLKALPAGSDLHKRTLAKMAEAENRLDAIARDLATARGEAEAARQTLRERVKALAI
ncbi:hypothetical protein VY88_06425 [Azospirillum thiophilum]|uniref:DUF4139 domain-containing protein n=1 Tax=Azospirillum thiophilum TaxID=528244 RepID=A0AAC8ZTG4_9PROT|nr:hypothetical protein [Azospirillum thiophilum]ALG70584.1 hypothetical protein AL072_06285 [Azospirillum thiophilum]KJR65744.1 hypothetical protein VY88_06425 [Azospirillum thiophilum]